ncbi:Iron-dependent repressor IdeR [Planctomycetes bacterium Pan216]|uniref:Transcriptional regulator MntR n=1 Tax=Kolteria novifilia TaxID=2527975 RepID=A0A518B5T3_9BACT|nr:Iron-dependent repressor IdeR [Planctomycetes bacterium Pan216]
MPTLTVENYVKAIYQICASERGKPATTGELAKRLGISPGSVTSMLRTLADTELAEYQAYEGVRLTEKGDLLALRILRRHRLVESFLVNVLDLSWDEVHEEAEHLEHAVSDRLVDRIDEYLGFPERDPHGDPIPTADGRLKKPESTPMAELSAGNGFILDRVLDQSPDFLRYLSESGLEIGVEAEIVENHPSAGALIVRTGDRHVSLGRLAADKLLVRKVS